VASVTVTAGGSGFTSAPTVAFSGGGGTGATVIAVLTGAVVSSIIVQRSEVTKWIMIYVIKFV
jgi:hypothetical protein